MKYEQEGDSTDEYIKDLLARSNAVCHYKKLSGFDFIDNFFNGCYHMCKKSDCMRCIKNIAMQDILMQLDSVELLELDSYTNKYIRVFKSSDKSCFDGGVKHSVDVLARSLAECDFQREKRKCKKNDCKTCSKNAAMKDVIKGFNSIDILELDFKIYKYINDMHPSMANSVYYLFGKDFVARELMYVPIPLDSET